MQPRHAELKSYDGFLQRRPEVVWLAAIAVVAGGVVALSRAGPGDPPPTTPTATPTAGAAPRANAEDSIADNSRRMLEEGRETFRFDTFGSEAFWGDVLHLHQALVRPEKGGVAGGAGVTARQALELGLKIDVDKLPGAVSDAIRDGKADLDSSDTTFALLQAGAVIGVKATFDTKDRISSMGITCALCHSTVDDSLAKGIGHRRDGWPNRDLDVGKIVASAPSLKPFTDALGVDEKAVKSVLSAWGPGRYDAELIMDGKGFRPDGKTAATLIPAAFGLAGQNLHTYSGWGSVPYWNAYVANTQMHGQGTFVDRRLADTSKFPVTARTGYADKRDKHDLITGKLASLHFYQLAIPAPTPPDSSFDAGAASRGRAIFDGKAQCAICHVPPLFSEPGYSMHTPAEIGIDDFQSSRSPDNMYRTTPLRGLFTRAQGGFYHDGRFADLVAVVRHYDGLRKLKLTDAERADLVEYLKSL
jgi:mono/diheme cytochrome c family protein